MYWCHSFILLLTFDVDLYDTFAWRKKTRWIYIYREKASKYVILQYILILILNYLSLYATKSSQTTTHWDLENKKSFNFGVGVISFLKEFSCLFGFSCVEGNFSFIFGSKYPKKESILKRVHCITSKKFVFNTLPSMTGKQR